MPGSSRCPPTQPRRWTLSRSWKNGSTRRWRDLRAAILAANRIETGGQCHLAIKGVCTGTADQVHHTKGRARTGDNPKHLVPACKACNLKVGDPGRTATPRPRPVSRW